MNCTFCGHSRLYANDETVRTQLKNTVYYLIEKEDTQCFMIGNYGEFDRMASSICLNAKRQHPHISVNLVIPYYYPSISAKERDWYVRFDQVIVPPLENTPYPYRIVKANQYMVDASDIVVSYVTAPVGGAVKTLAYAQRKKKRVIHLACFDGAALEQSPCTE